MIADAAEARLSVRWIWPVVFAALALYVAARLGAFQIAVNVTTPDGAVQLPDTFASVDHPFHVARAEMLWRELGQGHVLRWVSQHQGGYPVEFYPLGEAWLEVAIRVLSLGTLAAEAAHTFAVVALYLAPGIGFVLLARIDSLSPAVGLLALALHVALPGSWYHGGYTELVQWGLVTNVAGATAAFLAFPALLTFVLHGDRRWAAAAAALAAWAVYCNPRSVIGLVVLAGGAWLAVATARRAVNPLTALGRLAFVGGVVLLLSAPELLALVRFGNLYSFVHYSGYATLGDFVATTVSAVGLPMALLAFVGAAAGIAMRHLLATRASALALAGYVATTLMVAFIPLAQQLAPQLEPTRLMPLQRLLTLYLAAVAVSVALGWVFRAVGGPSTIASPAMLTFLAFLIVAWQTRPLAEAPPDPASPVVPAVSLYPVARSAVPEQADLERAIRLADERATPGTAILVIGSALSWHQQLWAPLWTTRPLYYDNWLWYWHPHHAGTPGYRPDAGHHYPDPERTLDRAYVDAHGIGAVVVTGQTRRFAAASPLLQPLREGVYDTYLVADPVTTATFDGVNAVRSALSNREIVADSPIPATRLEMRANWYPRWSIAPPNDRDVAITRGEHGDLEISSPEPLRDIRLIYGVQRWDWMARGLAMGGVVALVWLALPRTLRFRWKRSAAIRTSVVGSGRQEAPAPFGGP